ncbi:MAG: DUF4276 family protein [Synechococcaceae cyanobacterium SM1_2_3]|nr:DUF4276 family protein [Synechococcaceae cyanobacterium SM1_2_3]
MHFEILVEGQCERTALEPLLTKILGEYRNPHTWRIHKHRGVGRLPTNPAAKPNQKDPTLLHNLPSKLRAYGKSLQDDQAVIILVDLDDRTDCRAFKQEMASLLEHCHPPPKCKFRIAIEELEAWYFGDRVALKKAYPDANDAVLNTYIQDSQCGTWEKLADAIYPGGSQALKKLGVQRLEQKRIWACNIAQCMDINQNQSPSFLSFRDALRNLAQDDS